MSDKIVVVVVDGLVSDIFTNVKDRDIEVEIIDCDTQDWEELKKNEDRLSEVETAYKRIY